MAGIATSRVSDAFNAQHAAMASGTNRKNANKNQKAAEETQRLFCLIGAGRPTLRSSVARRND
jgi:hypothetical protein